MLRTRRAIQNRVLGIIDTGAPNHWVEANVLPIIASDGSIRRVLLTMVDVSERHWLEARLEQLSVRDPLTGAFNRRRTLHLLDEECHRSLRYGTPTTIALIDIDRFREFNETYGRATGDRLLTSVAHRIREVLREIDIVGRYGGGEFMLILPNVHLDDAMIPLERIRARIEAENFGSPGRNITISGGITECAGDTATALIERAHALLIQAKEAGRNRLCQDVEIF
ncbi:GGDEF domain-containing protein [Propionivibrio sp.]|uniref:GGDEF domain-containing protein n=1 Tax=Propionivibrio sp. TaxID=2212460 RepID=UPI003BF40091